MTDDKVFDLIKQQWESRDRDQDPTKVWDSIAQKLKAKGHVSARTGRPLTGGACRTIYYNFEKKPALPKNELKAQVEMMRNIISLSADPAMKLKLIQQVLDKLET